MVMVVMMMLMEGWLTCSSTTERKKILYSFHGLSRCGRLLGELIFETSRTSGQASSDKVTESLGSGRLSAGTPPPPSPESRAPLSVTSPYFQNLCQGLGVKNGAGLRVGIAGGSVSMQSVV